MRTIDEFVREITAAAMPGFIEAMERMARNIYAMDVGSGGAICLISGKISETEGSHFTLVVSAGPEALRVMSAIKAIERPGEDFTSVEIDV